MIERPAWFDEAMIPCMSSLLAYATKLTRKRSDAEDLRQLTLFKAMRAHKHFERGTNMKAWLFTIMRNEFLSARRTAGRVVEDVEGVFGLKVAAPPAQDAAYDLKIIYGQMERLDPEHRICLELVGIDRMTYEEVSELLGVPDGTVKSRVSRARTLMRDIYEGRSEAYRV